MKKGEVIGFTIICGISVVAVFHVCNYMLYCKHKGNPGKSHCAVCGHSNICQKCCQMKRKSND